MRVNVTGRCHVIAAYERAKARFAEAEKAGSPDSPELLAAASELEEIEATLDDVYHPKAA